MNGEGKHASASADFPPNKRIVCRKRKENRAQKSIKMLPLNETGFEGREMRTKVVVIGIFFFDEKC